MLKVLPIFQKQAFEFIEKNHRHHKKPAGSILQIAVGVESQNDKFETTIKIHGVAVVGRPVSRMLQNGRTAEVTRLCTDGYPNACSMLYAACWRAVKAMGYNKLVTYILDTEPGTTLNASGFNYVGKRGGGSWSRPSRVRTDKHPVQGKILYQKVK